MLNPYFNKLFLEAGCDEAGRGCLAGPVFAAAVVLPKNFSIPIVMGANFEKVNDSKKLTDEVRRELRPLIEKTALTYAIGIASVEEIDKINILNASFLAMHRAISKLKIEPELLLIDGHRFRKYFARQDFKSRSIPHECIIQGDGKFLSIACASILAKTYRDDYMNELHEQFPQYKWNQNKAYATRAHRFAIEKHGATIHHRKSFTLLASQLRLNFSTKKFFFLMF